MALSSQYQSRFSTSSPKKILQPTINAAREKPKCIPYLFQELEAATLQTPHLDGQLSSQTWPRRGGQNSRIHKKEDHFPVHVHARVPRLVSTVHSVPFCTTYPNPKKALLVQDLGSESHFSYTSVAEQSHSGFSQNPTILGSDSKLTGQRCPLPTSIDEFITRSARPPKHRLIAIVVTTDQTHIHLPDR